MAVIGDAKPLQRRAGASGEFLPGNQVGVVLEFGGDDHVTRTESTFETVIAEHVRHQIERLGGVLGEYQLSRAGTDERRDIGSALLEGVGGLLHQLMCATVHRTVGGGEEIPFGVEYLPRLLRGGPRVEIGQTLSTAHHPIQDRKIRANPLQFGGVEFDRDSHRPTTRRSYAR